MKTMMMTLMAVLMMGTISNRVCAQENEDRKPMKECVSPEQWAEQQANHMARELALDDATAKRFVETYCRYHQERHALMPEHGEKKDRAMKEKADGRRREALANPSEAECKQMLESRMACDQKLLDLRKKYYNEYSKFLTQKQIVRICQMEERQKRPMQDNGQCGKRCHQGKAKGTPCQGPGRK